MAQTDVQQLIQGLAPGSVNNGNPNTAYNNPAIPQVDAFGNWTMPTINPAANYNPSQLVLPPSSSINMPILPRLPTNGGGGTIPTTPTPPSGGGGGGGGTGGGTGGTGGTTTGTSGGGGTSPVTGGGLNGWFGGHTNGDINGQIGTIGTGGLGSGSTGGNSLPSGIGGLDWGELIDRGLDVIGIPGNWYLNGYGGWDASNALTSVLSGMTGLPIGSIVTAIGKYGADHGWSSNNFFVDHYLDNTRNDYANTYGTVGPLVPSITPGVAGVDFPYSDIYGSGTTDVGYANLPNYGSDWKPPTGNGGGAIAGGGINYGHGMNGSAGYTGAGTGYGVGVIQNDGWGSAASSFGLGAAGSGASAGQAALADAIKSAKLNRK